MLHVKLIVLGSLKEAYWREAVAEYEKRLGAFAKVEILELKEYRLPDAPGAAEIEVALEKEAEAVLAAIPPRAFTVALCVEGKQLSSEELATKLSDVMRDNGSLSLIIGSSHGLSPRVKAAADLRLSVSKLTFPHQLMRVLLLETVYRSLSILHGTKYHK
ncbi:MAG: 23S rRNA (pseudouridine(1915)-N(3))-methyltransferase RlmH [Ruminococcaceae bacterium]|nr:23S rRNA (pseudouridine(1915)-N(3))-methyltransferase RlmH [Oscillospiraceae bacterium]